MNRKCCDGIPRCRRVESPSNPSSRREVVRRNSSVRRNLSFSVRGNRRRRQKNSGRTRARRFRIFLPDEPFDRVDETFLPRTRPRLAFYLIQMKMSMPVCGSSKTRKNSLSVYHCVWITVTDDIFFSDQPKTGFTPSNFDAYNFSLS